MTSIKLNNDITICNRFRSVLSKICQQSQFSSNKCWAGVVVAGPKCDCPLNLETMLGKRECIFVHFLLLHSMNSIAFIISLSKRKNFRGLKSSVSIMVESESCYETNNELNKKLISLCVRVGFRVSVHCFIILNIFRFNTATESLPTELVDRIRIFLWIPPANKSFCFYNILTLYLPNQIKQILFFLCNDIWWFGCNFTQQLRQARFTHIIG